MSPPQNGLIQSELAEESNRAVVKEVADDCPVRTFRLYVFLQFLQLRPQLLQPLLDDEEFLELAEKVGADLERVTGLEQPILVEVPENLLPSIRVTQEHHEFIKL